jgi:hypothetical protein
MNARQWAIYQWRLAILRVQLDPRGAFFWAMVLLAGFGGMAAAVVLAGG